MAFSSVSWRYNVFLSFHGPDVRTSFLSHLRKQFEKNGIITFNDEEIERSQTIGPELLRAIQESRISIVVLSQKYASSSWCLDELVEIWNRKEFAGQIVMTVFYKVDPSDVRKQIGDFGKAFKETCQGKTETAIQSWTKALVQVANIAGEHSLNWVNEAKMVEKIATDVSNKLNATPSRDFDRMVGLETHLGKMKSLLHSENDEGMIVGISGPAGIGKTTIARALYNQLSCDFPLSYFMENVKGSYRSVECDQYGLKLRLQEQLLSRILDQNGMKISHLNVINERLHNQKVLIILDDVDHLEQLDALVRDISGFGPGSRIIVTTEDQELLQQHGINNIYHVGFPSNEEALAILCLSAFKQISPPDGFGKLAERAIELCSNLPLGLRVVGSSLRRKEEDEWEVVLHRQETSLDRDIESILRVGYKNLREEDQALFLYIAVFFNYTKSEHLKDMLGNLYESNGLRTLEDKSLIYVSTVGEVVMHKLLQQVGTQEIKRQEPWKRHILIDTHNICEVLEYEKGTSMVLGISFDVSDIDEVSIKEGAFKRMSNLRFLRVYKSKEDGNDKMLIIPKEMEFPRRLRLLDWTAYPSKSFPPRFHPEYLVELNMKLNHIEKLWQGTQPLANLKKMSLYASYKLKELPDLSNATNLKELNLSYCESLVEIPSTFSNLDNLTDLMMMGCTSLKFIPPHMNLASIESVNMMGCSRLRKFPLVSTNIIGRNGSSSIKTSTQVTPGNPMCLILADCKKLESLPEVSTGLIVLNADGCESLKRVPRCFNSDNVQLNFANCFKLSQEARRSIIQRSFLDGQTYARCWFSTGWACLPGNEVPAEFNHRARGTSLTIGLDCSDKSLNALTTFKLCVVISPNQKTRQSRFAKLLCRRIIKGNSYPIEDVQVGDYNLITSQLSSEHLLVFLSSFDRKDDSISQILFEFSSGSSGFDIIECGAQVWTEETKRDNKTNKQRNFWSLVILCFILATLIVLILCFDLSSFVWSIGKLIWGGR